MDLKTSLFQERVVLLKDSNMSLYDIANIFGEAYVNDPTERFNISADAKILRISNQVDENNKPIGSVSYTHLRAHET